MFFQSWLGDMSIGVMLLFELLLDELFDCSFVLDFSFVKIRLDTKDAEA